MARFGRGQPHAPIFLRAPLVAAVVAAATVSPIHVVTADRQPPAMLARRAMVAYVRPSRSSFVPDRLAPQIHVVQVQRPSHAPQTHTTQLRGGPAPAAPAAAPVVRIHVVSIIPQRIGSVHNGMLVGRPFLYLRNGSVPEDVGAPPYPIRVISPTTRRAAIRPDGASLYVRPSRSSFVPDRLTPQVHIVVQPRGRQRPPTRIVQLRNAPVPPAKGAPQFHIVLQPRLRATLPARTLLYLTNPTFPVVVTPDVGSLVLDGFAPTVTGISVTPSGVGGRRPGIDVERERIWRRYWWRIAQTEKAEQKLNKRRAALHLPPLIPSQPVPELEAPTDEAVPQARTMASLLFEARAEIKRLKAYIDELEDLNTAYLALLADHDIEVDDG